MELICMGVGPRVPPKPQQHPPWQDPPQILCWFFLLFRASREGGEKYGLLHIQSLGLLRTQHSPGAEQPVTGRLTCFIIFYKVFRR